MDFRYPHSKLPTLHRHATYRYIRRIRYTLVALIYHSSYIHFTPFTLRNFR